MMVYVCNPKYGGGVGRRIEVQGQIGKMQETLSKKKLKQRAGSMAQVVEHKALSLNPVLPTVCGGEPMKLKH
jgi:hypothetical protein